MRRVVTAFTLLLGLALLSIGCQTTAVSKPPTEQSMVSDAVAEWGKLIIAKNIDQLMTLYTDDFVGDQGATKAQTAEFLKKVAAQGMLERGELDVTKMKIALNGDIATAGPVVLDAAFGSAFINFTMKKTPAGYRISAMQVDTN